ncbi:MAG: hypothetical protein RIS73_963, partial [Bacteroidota bacterium]
VNSTRAGGATQFDKWRSGSKGSDKKHYPLSQKCP